MAAVRRTGRQPASAAQPAGDAEQSRLDGIRQSGFIQRRSPATVLPTSVGIPLQRAAVFADCASGSAAAVRRRELQRAAQLFRWWQYDPLVGRRKQQQGRRPPVKSFHRRKRQFLPMGPVPIQRGPGPFFAPAYKFT